MSTATRQRMTARTLGVDSLGGDGVRLRVQLPAPLEQPVEGGQFFMLRSAHPDFPFLSRPFSVHEALPDGCGPELHFLLKRVGPGTRVLADLAAGEPLDLVGPLGTPFPAAAEGVTSLLVAGGVGLPPLNLFLRRQIAAGRDEPIVLLYGGRSRAHLYDLDGLRERGVEVHTATEDGSEGVHGRVDVLLAGQLEERQGQALRILTCGPDPMMACVAELAAKAGVECLVSLETLMACGFGVCNACAVAVDANGPGGVRYERACLDGPVMDAARVEWHHGH